MLADANGVVVTTLPVSAPTTPGSFPVYFEVERTSYFATFFAKARSAPMSGWSDT